MFYSTLGELQLGRHREVEAEQALRPALGLAEQNLGPSNPIRSGPHGVKTRLRHISHWWKRSWRGSSAGSARDLRVVPGSAPAGGGDLHPQRSADRTLTNPPMPDVPQLASRLPLLTKETVLAYAALPDGLAIWVYDNRGVNPEWIQKPTEDLQELASRFHDLSADPKSELSALQRDARSLYERLIAPVEQHLAPGRTLVIEADGWLARVPFEALLDADGHYLVEREPMVHSLGQVSQARLRNAKAISSDLPALVVGSAASSRADGLIPSPMWLRRRMRWPAIFIPRACLRAEMPRSARCGASRPGPRSSTSPGIPCYSGRTGLMLGGKNEDGQANTPNLMDADTVRQLRLQSLQLAVLSACSTASGSGGSSGFDSVTDALLHAGVPHVIASRWAVDSAQTRGFVQDFYRNALLGQTVSDAVRLTSLKMLANPGTSHPYYWSAFAAYGRP